MIKFSLNRPLFFGFLQVWRNDVFMKSIKMHNGAVFASGVEGKWLFTGGWDKTVNIQVHVQNMVSSYSFLFILISDIFIR